MRLIEPCCASKQFMFLRDAIGVNGKTQFHGYGDLSLTELLPAILTRYTKTTMIIVAPSIPDQAYDIINQWMRKKWARMDGKGTLDCISHLTIVADFSEAASPFASSWLDDNPYGDRLTIVNRQQSDTAILLPDIVVTGPINMRYGNEFVCSVTTIPDEVSALWKQYKPKPTAKRKRSAKKAEPAPYENSKEAPTEETKEVPTDEANEAPTDEANDVTTDAPKETDNGKEE